MVSAPLPDSTGSSRPPAPRRRRALLIGAAQLLLLLIGLFALGVTAIKTQSGARTVWSLAARVLPGKLTGQVIGGTLADGLELRDVVYEDAKQTVRIDHVKAAWHLSPWPRRLAISFIDIGHADVTLLPSPPKPLSLPADIKLPMAFELQRARIEKLTLHNGAAGTTEYADLRLHAGSDGVHHQVSVDNADTPYGKLKAALRLDGNSPFPLDGSASLQTSFQQQQYQLDAALSGNLRALGINLRAAGGALAGSADIEATVFDAVPFRRAQIAISHLDPKVYSAAAPHADLSINATLAPVAGAAGDGRDLAKLMVAGPVSFANAVSGAIDKDLLPLVSGKAQVRLTAQRQELQRLELKMAGNATVTGDAAMDGKADGNLKLQVAGLDLKAVHGAMQPTQLAGPVEVKLAQGTQDITLALASKALALDASARIDARQVTLRSARLQAGASQLTLAGTLGRDTGATFAVKGAFKDFDPVAVLAQVQSQALTAPAAAVTGRTPASGPTRNAATKTTPSGTARNAATAGKKPASKAVAVNSTEAVHARINMDFSAEGAIRPEPTAGVRFMVHDSTYNDLPMTGGGTVRIAGKRLLASDATMSVAGNDLAFKGAFGAPADRLDFRIAAPALARLGFGLAGSVQADGQLAGSITQPVVNARYKATGLVIGEHRVASLAGQAQVNGVPGENPQAKVDVTLVAEGVHSSMVDLEKLDARIAGAYARHTLDLNATGRLSGQPLALTVAAQGALKQAAQGYAWDGMVRTLENRGVPRLSIGNPLAVSASAGQVTLGATRLTLGPAAIDLKGFEYRPGLIRSEGSFAGLPVADVLELQRKFTGTAPAIKTTLSLDASWKFSLADTASGFLQIDRRGGDIIASTPYGESALGIGAMRLRADLQGNRVALDARVDAARIGSVAARGSIGLLRIDNALTINNDSPLAVNVTGAIPKLRGLGALTGPQIALDGSIAMNLAAAGTLGAPKLSGNLDGDKLALTLYDQGVRLHDGTARIVLDNNFVDLREVVFHGGAGTLRATGRIPLEPTGQELTALITATRLELLTDPSKQLTLSGQARMANVNQQLQVTGRFTVDRALFTLPEKSAPQLSDDVVIVHQGATPKRPTVSRVAVAPPVQAPAPAGMASLLPPRVNITVDLGNNFRFKGAGADIFLAGALDVRSGPNQPPQAYGTVRVVSGVFEAFGAKLAIERGIISFQGPFDNPSVSILAMRRNQAVPAGVEVTGNARQPRVVLVSEPALSEEEKLSWLVFGKAGSASSGQAQGAVQGAAFGLLNKFGGASIASKVGLSELSIGSSEYGKQTAQVVNFGKEISKRLYIGYEQGLAGASSVVKLTYELTQNWSVVARGGAVAGLDVRYSRRFDKLYGKPVVP